MTSTTTHERAKSVYLTAAWTVVPVVVLVFLFLRFVATSPSALLASQLLFISAPLSAGCASLYAARLQPERSRVRLFWFMIGATLLLLAVSETLYSLLLLQPSRTDALVMGADSLNLLALLSLLWAIGAAAGLDRGGWRRIASIVIDTAIAVLLGFTVVYAIWSSRGSVPTELGVLLQSTAYVLAAGVLLTANVFAWRVSGRHQEAAAPSLVFASIMLCTAGMSVWPLWHLAGDPQSRSGVSVVSSALWLGGYLLALLAALDRAQRRDQVSMRVAWKPPVVTTVRKEALIAPVSLLAAGAAAWGAYQSPHGSPSQVVYLTVLSFAVVMALARAVLASINEADTVKRELTDELTGTTSPSALRQRTTDMVNASRRYATSFAIILVDVDDFGQVNASQGRASGDRVLVDVGARLSQAFGGSECVFRFMADQFAVLAEVDDAAHAAVRAREARGAVRSSREAGISLDASVGYAICPDDALEAEALLRKADQALAWAKNHGEGRVVGHDERVARAASSDLHVAEVERATRSELTRALLAVVDARDHSGFLHSRNVAAVTRLFGEDLGFSHDRLERLHIAALLHDVGYLAVADGRTSSSSAVRRKARHEHPRLGARMVETLGIAGITDWVLTHHERWDGNGFPRGVSAEQIPLEARMIALANTYDSLISGRRYGTPMTKRAALQEIDLGIGARFDPDLAERFIALVARTEALGWGDGGSAA